MTSKGKKRILGKSKDGPQRKTNKSELVDISVNGAYLNQEFKNIFSSAFHQKKSKSFENGAKIVAEPFPCCVLPNFIEQEEYVNFLKEEILGLNYSEKNNDLYKFHQSDDLKTVPSLNIKSLKKLLYEDFLPWLKSITDIPLNNTVDMTCSVYEYTDVLLCHDDELEGRRIAFIYYLVPEWKKEDGGGLDLFNSENGQPSEIITSLLPVWNNFVFFEVSPISFHQVAEILSEKTRLSISGWFHGPPFKRPTPFVELKEKKLPCHVDEEILRLWINPIYLKPSVQIQIQQKFRDDSEIELQDFLQESKYAEVSVALSEDVKSWKLTGPANKRHYEKAEELPAIVKECLNVLHSEAMFLILSNLTGLKLHELAVDNSDSSDEEHVNAFAAENSIAESDVVKPAAADNCELFEDLTRNKCDCNAKFWSCIRKWNHGCYTLLHDDDSDISKNALDAILYFNCAEWKAEYGGYTSYIAKGEDIELLTVEPKSNSLALVYRDQDTLRFVKYINHKVTKKDYSPDFHDIFTVYYE